MFSKNAMEEGTKFEFLRLKLADDFEIPDNNRSKVIFGYNGVGKTSIFRYIKEFKEDNRILFLDYIDERETFKKNKKKLIISANVNRINDLEIEVQSLKDRMNIKNSLSTNFNITNPTLAAIHGNKIKDAQKNIFNGFESSRDEIKTICDTLEGITPSVLIENNQILNEVNEVLEELSQYKNSIIFKSLVMLNDVVDTEDLFCPICESPYENIKDKINHRIEELNEAKSKLIENLKKSNITANEYNINKLIQSHSLLTSENLIADWMLCGGNINNFDAISNAYEEYIQKLEERNTLLAEAERMYRILKSNEIKIKNDISRYFSIATNKIAFKDETKTLTITLPRDVETYSTGEMNLLSFLIRIYEFIGSDKEILILDDPVSSLDIINHYKIVYEIVKAANSGKKIIILTHSIEMVNSINSQFSRDFDFYYIEETDKIHIQEIPRRDDGKNILTLDVLLSQDAEGIISALIEKENSVFNNDIHKLFHYDESFTMTNNPGLSNDYLVNMIAEFSPIENTNFIHNTYLKVIYIAALRVWIEYQMKILVETDDVLLYRFVNCPTLVNKVNVIFNFDGTPKVAIPESLTRDGLMCKKTMLNQGIHYQSQVMPFAYALNISLLDLNKEIVEIKEMFQ